MISRRILETATAVLTGTLGLAVAVSSLDNGIGWSSAGVDAGTFPFIVGVIIVAGSLVNLLRGVLAHGGVAIDGVAASWLDLRRIAALFVPAALYVGAIPLIGMYLATGGYMFGGLVMHKQMSWSRSVIIALATPVALYLVFERAFQVTLPRGAFGDLLGF
jgi:Tripartite tricarboxylate transporter TctB family